MAEGFAASARGLWNSRLDGPVRYIRALALKSGGATTIAACRNADAVLPCHSELFDAGVIGALGPRLKIIANHSVGTDHVDLAAARAAGIVVTNTPDVLSDATAEVAILCMAGAARRGAQGDALVRSGQWDFWSPAFMVGRQVTGKRFSVLGIVRVGQVAAERARGFGMRIHYHNRRRLPSAVEKGSVHDSLEGLLSISDVLSLHCPALPRTDGIINARTLALLPDRAIVVNTARGALIDADALVLALRSGTLFAAGLDVFRTEPAETRFWPACPMSSCCRISLRQRKKSATRWGSGRWIALTPSCRA